MTSEVSVCSLGPVVLAYLVVQLIVTEACKREDIFLPHDTQERNNERNTKVTGFRYPLLELDSMTELLLSSTSRSFDHFPIKWAGEQSLNMEAFKGHLTSKIWRM